MITIRTDLPQHVLGADASGMVTGQDYETVLVPAIALILGDRFWWPRRFTPTREAAAAS